MYILHYTMVAITIHHVLSHSRTHRCPLHEQLAMWTIHIIIIPSLVPHVALPIWSSSGSDVPEGLGYIGGPPYDGG